MEELEKQRIEEAKKCDNCLEWHKHCNAECCSIIFIRMDDKKYRKSMKYVVIKKDNPTISEQIYFKWRDVEYTKGNLKFLKKRITKIAEGIYMYVKKCKCLQDLKCIKHPDLKPYICKRLNNETKGEYMLTDNCLFRYK